MFFGTQQEPLYIISDVHGCAKSLKALILQLPNKEKSRLVFVGDLIDRGKYSCEVVAFVKQGKYACVIGNHEQLMLDANASLQEQLHNDNALENMKLWMYNGGDMTDRSYKGKNHTLLQSHLLWMQQLPHYLEFDIPDENGKTLFVTHGFGLPCWELKDEHETHECFKWQKLDIEKTFVPKSIFNVFGHDVQKSALPLITKNYAAIDTGCVYEGKLTAFEWPSKRIYQQSNIG